MAFKIGGPDATRSAEFALERIRDQEAMVRVAAGQTQPRVGCKAENLSDAVNIIQGAIAQGVDLLVLPELGNSGYIMNTRKEAFALSEPIPEGLTCQAILKEIKGTDLFVCAGMCERSGNVLYNAAVLLGPDGYVGTYRKIHLWDEEKYFFEPGDLGFPVFDLPFGRVGIGRASVDPAGALPHLRAAAR